MERAVERVFPRIGTNLGPAAAAAAEGGDATVVVPVSVTEGWGVRRPSGAPPPGVLPFPLLPSRPRLSFHVLGEFFPLSSSLFLSGILVIELIQKFSGWWCFLSEF